MPDAVKSDRGGEWGGTSREVARRAIYEALELPLAESEPLERWRTLQIDRAILLFLNGSYHDALTLALRARSAAADIPVAELGQTIHETIEQLRARVKALRDFYAA